MDGTKGWGVGVLVAGVLCGLPAAARAGTATTSTTTTSTTLACAVGPTLDAIACRLGEIEQLVSTAPDAGKLQTRLLKMLSRAQRDASDAMGTSNRKKEKVFLKRLATVLNSFNFTVRSLHGRRTIGSQTRTALMNLGPALRADVNALIKSL